MATKSGLSFLPEEHFEAHDFCFQNHNVLVELLRSAEKAGVLNLSVQFKDDADRIALENAGHVLEWLAETGRGKERDEVIRRALFPALLSDFLHFIYEALQASTKAKLNVTYALLRKPLQESLFIFERSVLDREPFVTDLELDPARLHSQGAGGVEVHAERIRSVLRIIGESDRFSPEYLAQLRYDKSAEDSFDGITNKALHLITTHKAIRTEPLNINFVFSDWESKVSQWKYLYSRLPYILVYSRRLLEYVASRFSKTDPAYLANIERRLNAAAIGWAGGITTEYLFEPLAPFLTSTETRLAGQCSANGWTDLRLSDLSVLSRSWGPPTRWQTLRRSLRRALERGHAFLRGIPQRRDHGEDL